MSSSAAPLALDASQAQSELNFEGSGEPEGISNSTSPADLKKQISGVGHTSAPTYTTHGNHSLEGGPGGRLDGKKVSEQRLHLVNGDSEECEGEIQTMSLTQSSHRTQHLVQNDQDSASPPLNHHSNTASATAREYEYLDPTPRTPRYEQSPSCEPVNAIVSSMAGHSPSGEIPMKPNAVQRAGGGCGEEESGSEIQVIMDQFGEDGSHPGEEEVMSSKNGFAPPEGRAPLQYPPRTTSLGPIGPTSSGSTKSLHKTGSIWTNDVSQPFQNREVESLNRITTAQSLKSPRRSIPEVNVPLSPQSSASLPKALPPEPDPEPDLPFDFHRFLEQLRHRTADPVAKFLRSFLVEFGKKQWMVHEQTKIISDFLAFIANKMAQCEVWRGVSEAEFDNAKEGMEKLVMNRLYAQTFSPAIPPPASLPESKGKKKDLDRVLGPARKGQHQEDIERDDVLGQKVRIYGWVQEEHLDIKPLSESGKRFLILAQQGI